MSSRQRRAIERLTYFDPCVEALSEAGTKPRGFYVVL